MKMTAKRTKKQNSTTRSQTEGKHPTNNENSRWSRRHEPYFPRNASEARFVLCFCAAVCEHKKRKMLGLLDPSVPWSDFGKMCVSYLCALCYMLLHPAMLQGRFYTHFAGFKRRWWGSTNLVCHISIVSLVFFHFFPSFVGGRDVSLSLSLLLRLSQRSFLVYVANQAPTARHSCFFHSLQSQQMI